MDSIVQRNLLLCTSRVATLSDVPLQLATFLARIIIGFGRQVCEQGIQVMDIDNIGIDGGGHAPHG
jgi:hypothetical protein